MKINSLKKIVVLVLGLLTFSVSVCSSSDGSSSSGFLSSSLAGTMEGDASRASPVDNQHFADQEEHDGDLSDGEEAPNGSLFEQVGGDGSSGGGAGNVQDETLEDHALLFIHGEEGSEHQEGVDTSAHDVVGGVSHGDGPAEVDHGLSLEGAELFTTDPFGGGLREGGGPLGNEGHRVTKPHQETAKEAEALDKFVLIVVFFEFAVVLVAKLWIWCLAQGFVDDVAEVRLEADVDEAGHSERFVEDGLAQGVSDAGGEVEVLDSLEGFHGEEEEDTLGKHKVAGTRVDPP